MRPTASGVTPTSLTRSGIASTSIRSTRSPRRRWSSGSGRRFRTSLPLAGVPCETSPCERARPPPLDRGSRLVRRRPCAAKAGQYLPLRAGRFVGRPASGPGGYERAARIDRVLGARRAVLTLRRGVVHGRNPRGLANGSGTRAHHGARHVARLARQREGSRLACARRHAQERRQCVRVARELRDDAPRPCGALPDEQEMSAVACWILFAVLSVTLATIIVVERNE